MAQSLVARKLISMGGQPELRTGFTSDNGNVILDVRGLDLTDPLRMEAEINLLAGVVDNGLFAVRRADVLLVGTDDGVDQLQV
jgi:ribose 5-phosphate isomerase A